MRKLLILTLLTPLTFFAQKNVSRVVARDVIDRGIKLHDEEKYAQAIEEYQKVNINDTAYALAQYETALSHMELENYHQATQILNDLLKYQIRFNFKHTIYLTLGSCYDMNKKPEEAIRTYTEGLKLYPYQHNLLYNRGITYANQKKYKEAISDYKQAIQSNVYHGNSHLALGLLAAHEGLYDQAMLSLLTFLWLAPDDSRAPEITAIVERLSNGSFEKEPKNIKELFGPDNYEDYNLLFENKIALQDNYKVKLSIPTSYGRQLHLFLKNNSYDKSNMDFWNQHYLPFFEKIWKGKMLDQFCMVPLTSVKNEGVQSKVKSKISAIKTFYEWSKTAYKEATSDQFMEFEGKMQWVNVDYQPSHLEGIGIMNDKKQVVGNYFIYHKNGLLKMRAQFGEDQKQIGTWEIYNDYDGKITRRVGFTSNPDEKIQYSYYPSGELYLKYRTINDLEQDTVTYFYRNGTIKECYLIKDGKKNGIYRTYYANGQLSLEMQYKMGLGEGNYVSYYSNGTKQAEFKLVNDNIDGISKGYHTNGQLASQYNYVNGKYDGEYVNYFYDGTIEKKGTYKNDNEVGKFEEYFFNGAMAASMLLDESGKQNGINTLYDLDGKKYEELEFSKGELKSITHFDKAGNSKIISEKKGKKLDYIRTYPDGKKSIEGQIIDDERVGEWKYYDKYGNLTTLEKYKDGKLTDTLKEFFSNGQLESFSLVNEGRRDGLFQVFNIFGDLVSEGYYSDGEYDSQWIGYYSDGSFKYKNFFVQGRKQGYQLSYDVNGKLEELDEFDDGLLIAHTQFDTTENIISQMGEYNGEIQLKDPTNSYVTYIGNYKNGTADGIFKWFTINQVLTCEGTYKNGDRDGVWRWYNENGKLTREAKYVNANLDGVDKNYHDNGVIQSEFTYVNGVRQGKFTHYSESGKVIISGENLDDQRHGEVKYFDLNGSLMMVRYYNYGIFTSYSYLNPEGKLVKPVELAGNEMKVACYYKTGKKSMEHLRKNGLIEGHYITYHENGKTWEDESFLHGEQHGKSIEYNELGKKIKEADYLKGELHGKYLKYNQAGTLVYEANYRFGELNGDTKEYNADGKLIRIITYYGNVAVKVQTF
ncbi:toxin-antitoxin system YwqK family antitoxin [Fluviicola chungangensis]|uniref:Tetratricopeptide repeat protein n=1 Tax=Fluviicola chungangensis TaxID=2597671 RepID=A0A556MJZ2_9FLAO|nr:toxin-antitoxin system YwqK family antitoxin [Fluviicola chungangensis]TSJ40155.1 tetratricopeptide repeat protein [Fluviicola chungangensis]